MTRDEIDAMPPDELTALLAERVMGWALRRVTEQSLAWCDQSGKIQRLVRDWNPTTDRNNLAELLAAVPENSVTPVANEIYSALLDRRDGPYWSPAWLALTCDPLVICRAVAVKCCGGDE